MAGDFVPESELNLQGMQKYFNSYTKRGRFNFVVATYAGVFGTYFMVKLMKKKPAQTAAKLADSKSCS